MKILPRRRKREDSQFERAADGSMTLMEHLRELRSRLLKACLAILGGVIIGWLLAKPVLGLLQDPYCELDRELDARNNGGVVPVDWKCEFVTLGVADPLLLNLKIALWVGLIVAAPLWLYQIWAFVAPGLHRHERRWAYLFAGLAAPLFAGGAVLAFFVVSTGLDFLLQFTPDNVEATLEMTKYVDFITNLMLIFGIAFEFPLGVMLLNVAGVVSAKRLIRWWRAAVLICFVFAAIATPTADPFGMTGLALSLCVLYFAAVGFAYFNDRRRAKRQPSYAGISDDEASSLDDYGPEPALGWDRIDAPEPVAAPLPLERRYDDIT